MAAKSSFRFSSIPIPRGIGSSWNPITLKRKDPFYLLRYHLSRLVQHITFLQWYVFPPNSMTQLKKTHEIAIAQRTLSRFQRELQGPTNRKGAYHYPAWSGDSNGTIKVVQKSLVFANTLANLKTATLNYIYRFLQSTDAK